MASKIALSAVPFPEMPTYCTGTIFVCHGILIAFTTSNVPSDEPPSEMMITAFLSGKDSANPLAV